jgi:HEAT repeat protein
MKRKFICFAVAAAAVVALGLGIGWCIGDPIGREIFKLRHGPRSVRVSAATALGTLGAGDARVVPALAAALKDESESVIIEAVGALRRMGPCAAKAVPALAELVERHELACHWGAVDCLARIGPDAKAAIPALLAAKAKRHQEWGTVRDIILALSRIDPARHPDNDEIKTLTQMLKTRESPWPLSVRADAARVLGAIGSRAKAAVPALVEHLNRKNRDIAELSEPHPLDGLLPPGWKDRRCAGLATVWASFALARIDPAEHPVDDTVATLIGLLRDADSAVACEAAKALGLIGPEAEAALPALKEVAKSNRDSDLRRIALRALKQIRRDATDSGL